MENVVTAGRSIVGIGEGIVDICSVVKSDEHSVAEKVTLVAIDVLVVAVKAGTSLAALIADNKKEIRFIAETLNAEVDVIRKIFKMVIEDKDRMERFGSVKNIGKVIFKVLSRHFSGNRLELMQQQLSGK